MFSYLDMLVDYITSPCQGLYALLALRHVFHQWMCPGKNQKKSVGHPFKNSVLLQQREFLSARVKMGDLVYHDIY